MSVFHRLQPTWSHVYNNTKHINPTSPSLPSWCYYTLSLVLGSQICVLPLSFESPRAWAGKTKCQWLETWPTPRWLKTTNDQREAVLMCAWMQQHWGQNIHLSSKLFVWQLMLWIQVPKVQSCTLPATLWYMHVPIITTLHIHSTDRLMSGQYVGTKTTLSGIWKAKTYLSSNQLH